MSTDSITLTGLRITAHHGVFDFERENGQEFVIDVTVWLDFRAAAAGDDLARTIHYGELATEVADAVRRDPVDLVETLAERIADVVLAHEAAQRVRVTVHKPEAPIEVPFADVSVQIERVRTERVQTERVQPERVQTRPAASESVSTDGSPA